MAFPPTPKTLISKLKGSEGAKDWQDSWRRFFDLYDAAIQISVVTAFRRCGWERVNDDAIHEVVASVVLSFFQNQQRTPYDASKGRLRYHLAKIADWRAKNYIDRQQKKRLEVSLDYIDDECEFAEGSALDEQVRQWKQAISNQEKEAFDQALLQMLLEDAKVRVSPRNWLIFDCVKIQQKSHEEAMTEFSVSRSAVDNAILKVMNKLRDLATSPDYLQELDL